MNFTILRFDSIDSTNSEAINQARIGAEEGLCIIARRQTAGRGRHGRTWISEKDSGLYFSLILRPKIETKFVPLITLMTAIAVHDTLEETYAVDCDIKWVNDVHIAGKKICGILAETTETIKGFAVIVGIGINLKSSNFSPEIAATSIEAETGKPPETENLLLNLTRFLSYFCDILYGADGAEKIRQEWIRRSSYAYGKRVRARLENEIIEGETCGIAENGALKIKLKSGEIRTIHAGEIEQLRAT